LRIAPTLIIILIAVLGLGVLGCKQVIGGDADIGQPESLPQTGLENQPGSETETHNSAELSFHFLELGNQYTGDSIYINYGDIDILIDAGSRRSSSATIRKYIDNYIQDNKLEYIIVTHAHQDHIDGFTETNKYIGILPGYEIGIIIEFPLTNSTTATYSNYKNAMAAAEKRGAVRYTALQCYNNQDGAQREYELGDGIKLEILYNYYYDHTQNNGENNYSVCFRIVQDGNQYLFTGDLEKDGEDRLVDYYAKDFGGLGHCVLYKAGHHGSVTSSNIKLMSAITPEYVFVTACVGTSEYTTVNSTQFPSQDFINRIAPYTNKVYATTYAGNYPNFESFNGNIVFSVSENGTFNVNCSNNNLILKETEWFKNNRTMPSVWK